MLSAARTTVSCHASYRRVSRSAPNPNSAIPSRDFGMNGARSGEQGRPRWTGHDGPVCGIPAARMKASRNHRVPLCRRAVTRRARRPDEHAADLQPTRGRADAPAGAGAAEQPSDGPGVRTGGVGTNRGEVVDRGVHVEEGVDRGERGLRGGQLATVLGVCLTANPGCRLAGVGGFRGEEPAFCPPVVRGSPQSCRQPGWAGGPREPPPAGATRVRGVLAPAASTRLAL